MQDNCCFLYLYFQKDPAAWNFICNSLTLGALLALPQTFIKAQHSTPKFTKNVPPRNVRVSGMILKRGDGTRCLPRLDLTRLRRGADAYFSQREGRNFASGHRLGCALLFIIDPANFVGHFFERLDRSLQRYLKKFSIAR